MHFLCRKCSTEDLQKSVIYVGLADLMLELLRFYLFQWATESQCETSLTWLAISVTLTLVAQILTDLILVIGASKERSTCVLAYLILIPTLFVVTFTLAGVIIASSTKCCKKYFMNLNIGHYNRHFIRY
ncbi:uncharacterized protein Dwil_GK28148 [Drosophila willistoni]|uniref:Uncharacterized protein n=1 Tax=Drosophila willistoni TaxID=7260 RepID=A0A0Q9WRE2_DROWI|nr:uncharacterized protein Dwil_GK28148 [Drosophila willistoni]